MLSQMMEKGNEAGNLETARESELSLAISTQTGVSRARASTKAQSGEDLSPVINCTAQPFMCPSYSTSWHTESQAMR